MYMGLPYTTNSYQTIRIIYFRGISGNSASQHTNQQTHRSSPIRLRSASQNLQLAYQNLSSLKQTLIQYGYSSAVYHPQGQAIVAWRQIVKRRKRNMYSLAHCSSNEPTKKSNAFFSFSFILPVDPALSSFSSWIMQAKTMPWIPPFRWLWFNFRLSFFLLYI